MTIIITRQSADFATMKIDGRYVRYEPTDGTYRWCQTTTVGKGAKKRTVDAAVGMCDGADLPGEVAAAARNACVASPPYVEWPISISGFPA